MKIMSGMLCGRGSFRPELHLTCGANHWFRESGMRRSVGVLLLPAALLMLAASASAKPVGNIEEIGAAILPCWHAPAAAEGSFVTLSFSFKRDGTLIGPPQPTDVNIPGDAQAKEQFVNAAVVAVKECVPLEFSDEFAAGVAGQIFTLQFATSGVLSVSPDN